jgi:Glycosyl transferase family group 2
VLCPGKAALNAAFICGTNVVIRASALDEIGGLPQDSVTEDFAASIVLHRRWRSVYLSDVLATGLGPLDIPSYLRQQGRWARGTLGVLGSNWRDIFLPRKNGLGAGQRAQYALACTHYLCGLRDLIYMLSPILFIVTAIPAVRKASLGDYLWHFLPYAVLALTAMWYSARRVSGLRGIIIGFGSFPALMHSLAAVILRRKTGFSVTAKSASQRRSFGYLAIYVCMVLLCLAALVWAARANGAQRTSLFISMLWIVYSLLLLGSFLGLARADRRAHAAQHRGEVAAEVATKQRYPSKLLERPSALRPLGTLGLAIVMASPLLVSPPLNSSSIFAPHARAFAITEHMSAAPYVGVSLPVQLLQTRPRRLEDDLGIRFAMLGRTQSFGDRFDTEWADDLAAQGARPWITLEFGELGRNGTAPLSANLPAIYHGLRDADIKRWARQIRDFQRPVYLTILPHADKDWSASSGVAHGGIPEDVPKAWLHVQSVFRAAGAKNVAWIWAPADPLRDQEFAPPNPSIDAVLQSFVNYPGTRWGDPRRVLDDLTRRYPDKPIFVEASAAGPAQLKAEWLARFGDAVEQTPRVYAVLYHEGGPALAPTKAEEKYWSLASDTRSLTTVKRVFGDLATERSIR